MGKQTISIRWLDSVVELLRANGLDGEALFEEVGLDWRCLSDTEARCSTEQLSALWALAAARSGNPAIGLAIAQDFKLGNLDAVAYAMASCRDLRGAIRRLAYYLHAVNDPATLLVMENRDECWLALSIDGGQQPVPRPRMEHAMVSILALCRWASGHDLRPRVAHLSHSPPSSVQPYYQSFRCPLRFDAPDYRMLLHASDLALPVVVHGPAKNPSCGHTAQETLSCQVQRNLNHQVRQLVVQQLPDGDPKRAHIAHALNMGESTLQRRLRSEGMSFQQLVDDTRRSLAGTYLGQKHMPLAQVAFLLGFSEPGAFLRKCSRWFDMTAQQYRRQRMVTE